VDDGIRAPRWRSELDVSTVIDVLSTLFDEVLLRSATGVLVLDDALRFRLVNQAAADLAGVDAEDHMGRYYADLMPAAAGLVPVLRRILDTGEAVHGLEFRTPIGPHPADNRWFRVTIMRIDAPAADRGRLLAGVFDDVTEQREQAEKLARLAEIGRGLTAAASTDDIADVLRDAGDVVGDAAFVNIAMYDQERRALRLSMPPGLDPEVHTAWVTRPLDGSRPSPLTDAYERGEPIFVSSMAESDERYPHFVGEASRLQISATAAMPMRNSASQVIGVLGVGWADEVELSAAVLSRLEVLSDLCGQALQRAARTDADRELVRHLQNELLAGVDPADGLEVAVGYRPAVGTLGFGGDWYDVVSIRPDATAVIVGDVVGHGVEAAAQMAQAKGVMRALVLSSDSLGSVFPDATRSLSHLATSYVATVAVAVVDRAAGELSWTTAGHLPPILAVPGREPELLWGPVQPPVGMAFEPVEVPSRPIVSGSLLVVYTDGLVERRDSVFDDRLAQLVALVADLPQSVSAADARDVIVAAMVGDAAEDDVAIVVTRLP
jgi:PAS domain S-box-containing protein